MHPAHQLAQSLKRIKAAARDEILRRQDISRPDFEIAKREGFLHAVIRGWYILASPDAADGSTTLWYSSYWNFLKHYLSHRFREKYVLSADSSLNYHLDRMAVPRQITVQVDAEISSVVLLPQGTSIVLYRMAEDFKGRAIDEHGLRVLPLPLAIARSAPSLYTQRPEVAEIALRMVRRPSFYMAVLNGNERTLIGRLVGAYRHIGMAEFADQLYVSARTSGVFPVVENPFDRYAPVLAQSVSMRSPYVGRIRALWARYREPVANIVGPPLGPAPRTKQQVKELLQRIELAFRTDAYNSLSIEGYKVTPELIDKIAAGVWNPDDPDDRNSRNALAAKGYREAYKAVKNAVEQICIAPDRAAVVVTGAYDDWRRLLFASFRDAGAVNDHHLVGYRDHPVYIRNARHVPPHQDAVTDCMEAFDALYQAEPDPAVRAVLGHFLLVFIHPYADGNGRTARFIMNAELSAAGYPWTVIELARRDEYFSALDAASTENDIAPFAKFIKEEMAIPRYKAEHVPRSSGGRRRPKDG